MKKALVTQGPQRFFRNTINERYTKLLKENSNLTLHDCISLDAIKKGHRIDEEIAQDLLKRGLIEGEAPNYTISLGVAKASHPHIRLSPCRYTHRHIRRTLQ